LATKGFYVVRTALMEDAPLAQPVIARLRATEQRAGMLQAEAALREATVRETEGQTHYQRISDMFERKVVARAMVDEATANRDAAVARRFGAFAGSSQFTRFVMSAKLTVAEGTDQVKARALLERAEHSCLVANSLRGNRTLEAEVTTTPE
jgi:hypothetical protein